ncbi:MAG: FAD binding domain-containing protein [Syntrophaceae bacterium]|nr:FAD binding domain-containing protein [Syntrophaceae bacterium]
MMRLPKMDYIAPASVMEACSLLDKHGPEAKVLGGGTDLLVESKLRNIQPALLVALSNIKELKGIRVKEGDVLKIGAMTTLHDIRQDAYIAKTYPALVQAAAAVGTTQLQYMGTLGGNLCLNTRCIYYNQSDTWRKSRAVCFKMGGEVCHVVPKGKKCYAMFSGDTVPALIALDAQIKLISSKGERLISLRDLYTGDGKEPIAIHSGELLSDVHVPPTANGHSSIYLKYRIRNAIDFPLVGVAARMDTNGNGACVDCKVVLNAVGPAPVEVPEVRELFKGQSLTEDLINQVSEKVVKSAHPVANTAGSTPAYRRKMAGILTRRALSAIARDLTLI